MTKLRTIIADDERPAREYLRAMLLDLDNVDIVGEAANGEDALEMIVDLKPDLALLDLQMPVLSGLDVVRSLDADEMPLVTFVTAHDDFAIKAFELNAVDYLLKPVERRRLRESIDRAAARMDRDGWQRYESERVRDAAGSIDPSSKIERIPVRHRDSIILVPVAEVASLTADGELLNIVTADRERYFINYRLKDIESRLDPRRFVRLSRSAIVNLDHVDRITNLPGGTFLVSLSNGQEFAASRLQSRTLREKYLKL
ncbi:MAG: LytR/AlgR family response regulator transcription factor [Pyrinomonadaceae bacterium]